MDKQKEIYTCRVSISIYLENECLQKQLRYLAKTKRNNIKTFYLLSDISHKTIVNSILFTQQ